MNLESKESVVALASEQVVNPPTTSENNLELLRNHEELQEMLKNDPVLADYIRAIDKAEDPYEYLAQLKSNERFNKFKSLVLSILKN